MNVLFLAPQPFYIERGTPIAVRSLIEALSREGWRIDLLTYHEGTDIVDGNVHITRIRRLPGTRHIPPGLSLKKIICDVLLFFRAVTMIRRKRYDYIHAVEESVFMALILKALTGLPYVYDMDSRLSEQIVNKKGYLRIFLPFMGWLESLAVRHAMVVVPVCDTLAEVAERLRAASIVVLRDAPLII